MTRRRWLVLALAAGLVALAVAVLLWPTDRSRIQGTWVGNGVRLTFDGDLAVMEWDGESRQQRTYFRLDPSASPPRIVVFDADSPAVKPPTRVLGVSVGAPMPGMPADECHGIYELQGDRLRICLPLPGADFPANFDPAEGAVLELRHEFGKKLLRPQQREPHCAAEKARNSCRRRLRSECVHRGRFAHHFTI